MPGATRGLFTLLLVLFAIPSRALSQKAPPVYREALLGAPVTLDPHRVSDTFHLGLISQIFEAPLEMHLGEGGHCEVRPGLCALPGISEDGLTITLRLTQPGTFHDDPCFPAGAGRRVTAGDLRYTFLRHADPSSGSVFWDAYLAGRIAGLDAWREETRKQGFADPDLEVEGLRVAGDALVLRLVQPFPQLPALLTQPWAAPIPAEAVHRYGTGFGSRPVGAGPFRLESADPVLGYAMKRHPGYRIQGKPRLEELRFEILTAAAGATEAIELADQRFARGELSAVDVYSQNRSVYFSPRGVLKSEWARKGVSVHRTASLEASYIVFNFRHAFLKNPAVRQAMMLAFDRRRFAEACEGPSVQLLDGPLPSALPESRLLKQESWTYAKPDLARAKRILREAGFPDGEGIPEIILDAPLSDVMPGEDAAVKHFVADMARIGISVQRRAGGFPEFMERARAGELHMAWLRWYADYPDAENFLTLFKSSPGDPMAVFNYGDYRSEEFDGYYDKMCRQYPGPVRDALIERMVRIFRRDLPWIPVYEVQRTRLVDGRLRNYAFNILNLSLRDVEEAPSRR